MNPDFVDLLRALSGAEVRFLIVGAYALALYSKPRATGHLDLWVEPIPENGARVIEALKAFGAPSTMWTHPTSPGPGSCFKSA
jgi:hypothetical protein